MGYVLVKYAAPAAGAALRAGGALASKIGVKGAVKGAVGLKTLQSLNDARNQAKDISENISPFEQNQGQYEQLAAETRQMLRDKASTNPAQFS